MEPPSSGEESDVEKAVLKEGSPSLNKAHDDPPCNQTKESAASFLALTCKFPHLLIGPAFLFCLIAALGIFGVVYSTRASYDAEQNDAREEALSAAKSLGTLMSFEVRAAMSVAAVVKMNPDWSFLESNFPVLAEELFRQSNPGNNSDGLKLMELNLVPFGRVKALMSKPIQRNSTADIFSPELIKFFRPYDAIAENDLFLLGPTPVSNSEARAFTTGYPIFFDDTNEDESWGHPDNITHPTGCPGPPCYNAVTRRKFWGFAGALIDAGPILSGENLHLDRLLGHGLSYKLTIQPSSPQQEGTFVRGGPHPEKVTASVPVELPGISWTLTVYSSRVDDVLALRDGLIAMVVVIAIIVSGLLLLLLLSAKRTSCLLKEQLVTNKLLQEEKVSREALLGRQLDLIACLEQNTKRTKARRKSKLSAGQQSTIDQIEQARAQISAVRRGVEENINIQKPLAEGSFGKVYKGQWRGIDVAVKVIMLPRNMSGMEKREKMVVWEAAISSSLTHPNICQTYHYRIKPVKEGRQSSLITDNGVDTKVVSGTSISKPQSSINPDISGDSVPEDVHSYEVHLVLEYCDQSSLRDALDAGAFMAPTGMNYAAQLDCALDVAKAMFHLHCNNVLHLDLKTHNILLSSSSAEGKGLICKVSDFGLSVRMDHLETHVSSLFQGTLTHMAPEVMLNGTCSKASDVYAFGIVLWELFTGGLPFRGIPLALLGHSIVRDGKRPVWPGAVPKGYKDLGTACWHQNPDARPTFEVILKELHKLREELGTPTRPLKPFHPAQRPQNPPVQEKPGASSRPSLAQMPPHDVIKSQSKQGWKATPSEAQVLMEAWLMPRRNKQSVPQAEGPSPPHQTGSQTPERALTPPQEEVPHPKHTLVDTSMGAHGLKSQGGSLSASLMREEEGKTGRIDLQHEQAGQGGLSHTHPSPQEGCNGSSKLDAWMSMPGPPLPGPLMKRAPATPPEELLPDQKCSYPIRRPSSPTEELPLGPSMCSAPPVHSSDAAEQHIDGGSHGNSSCSFGYCNVSSHLSCAGQSSHRRRSTGREWNKGEPLVSSSPQGGPNEPQDVTRG